MEQGKRMKIRHGYKENEKKKEDEIGKERMKIKITDKKNYENMKKTMEKGQS